MKTESIDKITQQAAGAFGEKAVEAELLRRNWIPANVNDTIKNAAKFDIFAVKGSRSVQIQVKTCRPGMPAFLCSGFQPDKPITSIAAATDFTIVVRMGDQHGLDQFYIVPTAVAYEEIGKRQSEHAEKGVKDIGMWRLSFASCKKGEV